MIHLSASKKSITHFFFFLALLGSMTFQLGCATVGQKWKELITGQPMQVPQAQAAQASAEKTFNEQNQMLPTQDRRYRRVNRKNFDEGAQLGAKSGSLWVMEGQGAYLFAENTVRMIGDSVAIKIEGEPKEQLTAKADVIAGLIKQLEDRRKRAMNLSQNKGGADGAAAQKAGEDAPGANPGGNPAAGGAADPAAAAGRAPASDGGNYNVKMVPARVVERLVDGNYRVKGTQSFMIGSREYKTIVSGIVRAEDFNEQGVNATQLMDSSFDIVSAKGAELRQ